MDLDKGVWSKHSQFGKPGPIRLGSYVLNQRRMMWSDPPPDPLKPRTITRTQMRKTLVKRWTIKKIGRCPSCGDNNVAITFKRLCPFCHWVIHT